MVLPICQQYTDLKFVTTGGRVKIFFLKTTRSLAKFAYLYEIYPFIWQVYTPFSQKLLILHFQSFILIFTLFHC